MTPERFKPLASAANHLSRRTVIQQILGASASLASPGRMFALQPIPTIRVRADEGTRIPYGFTGLSYESSQLSHPQFFSSDNHDLIQFFRTLGNDGVLRLGGNKSEYTVWDPTGSAEAGTGETEGPDPGNGTDRIFPVTPRSIDNLAGLLDEPRAENSFTHRGVLPVYVTLCHCA